VYLIAPPIIAVLAIKVLFEKILIIVFSNEIAPPYDKAPFLENLFEIKIFSEFLESLI
jgi:hypothetical protein